MTFFLVITFLFAVGSLFGWTLELVYRRFFSKNNPSKKWINPGFLTGPYLPLYGFSLCILFLLTYVNVSFIENVFWQKIALFAVMALCITFIEYIAGLIFIHGMKIKLWDYSKCWGNIQGIICPLYTFFWWILSALYYFLIHPKINEWLFWFVNHISYSFFVGIFYGIFIVDLFYSLNIMAKIRKFAKENQVVIRIENFKHHLREENDKIKGKIHFLFSMHNEHQNLFEGLKAYIEKIKQNK